MTMRGAAGLVLVITRKREWPGTQARFDLSIDGQVRYYDVVESDLKRVTS